MTVYGAIANEIKTRDGPPPMTCIGGTVDPNPDEVYCPVSEEYHAVPVHVLCILYVHTLLCLSMPPSTF